MICSLELVVFFLASLLLISSGMRFSLMYSMILLSLSLFMVGVVYSRIWVGLVFFLVYVGAVLVFFMIMFIVRNNNVFAKIRFTSIWLFVMAILTSGFFLYQPNIVKDIGRNIRHLNGEVLIPLLGFVLLVVIRINSLLRFQGLSTRVIV